MPLRDLNWRKGLFRLWLFLSVLWVVAIGLVLLYPATSRYLEYVKAAHEINPLRSSISYKFLEESDKLLAQESAVPKTLTDDQMAELTAKSKPAPKGLTDDEVAALLAKRNRQAMPDVLTDDQMAALFRDEESPSSAKKSSKKGKLKPDPWDVVMIQKIMPTGVSKILQDPNFQGLPAGEQQKVLRRVDPNFAGLQEAEQAKVINYLNAHNFTPQPRGESYKVQEIQTGVIVSFEWYETRPPDQTDLHEVFRVALGLPPTKEANLFDDIIPDSPNKLQTTPKRRKEVPSIIPPPQPGFIIDPFDQVPEGVSGAILSRTGKELSENESSLASKLQRIRELGKILDSLKCTKQDFLVALSTVFLPPLALLVFGTGLLWALSGFAPKQSD